MDKKSILLICILLIISLSLADPIPTPPTRSASSIKPIPTEPFGNVWQLDSSGNYWLFWKTNSTHITFETHVKTKGYVGFGLSTNGKMFPADVVVGWIENNGTVHFKVCILLYMFTVYYSLTWQILDKKLKNAVI